MVKMEKAGVDLNKKITKSNVLLFFYLLTLILGILINSHVPHSGFNLVRIILFGTMLLVAMIGEKHDIYQYSVLISGLLFLLYGLINFPQQQINYLYLIICIFTMSTVSPKKIIFWSILVMGICTLVLYISSSLGIIANDVFYRGNQVRQSWGTTYPLTFASYIFFIGAGLVFLAESKQLKKKVLLSILLIIGAIITDRLTGARNFTLGLYLLVPIVFIKDSKNLKIKYLYRSIIGIILALCIISTFITKIVPYYSNIYAMWNKLLSGRLALQDTLMNFYSPKLFGEFIPQVTESGKYYFFIDNAYMRMLYFAGILFFVYFVVIVGIQLNNWLNNGNLKIISIVLVILITGMVQGSMISVSADIFLPLLCINTNRFYRE